MRYKNSVALWIEKMNPQLLLEEQKSCPLNPPKRITLHDGTEVLIVNGIDNVYYQEALEAGIFVLLVEENKGKITTFLQNDSFIPHENLYISTSDQEQLFPILKKFVFKKLQQVGDLAHISSYIGGMEMSFSEYRDLGKYVLPNILSNLLHIHAFIDGRELIGCLEGEEVIVCGSGISLEGAIQEIKKMSARPYIFATGSSLPRLLEAGIIPDFFAAIDPFPIEDTFCAIKHTSIPLFYQNRAARDLLYTHNGPKIFMGSAGGWQIEESLMQEIGIESFFFDAGCNAGNFGVHIALSLGASKVVLVGMDGIAREGEDSMQAPSGEKTRADLLYGMDFLKRLQENFTDRELVHYTKGLSFEGAKIVNEIVVRAKGRDIDLPKEISYECNTIKKVIDRYFDHNMLASVADFLKKAAQKSFHQEALAACLLAEFSLEPFYQNFMQPLYQVWQYLIPNAQDVIAKITFFYSLLKSFDRKTGYDQGGFFLFGNKEGEVLSYDCAGTLREETYFYNGAEEGVYRTYKSDGSLLAEQEMSKGLRHGLYKVYDGAHLIRSGEFVEGKPHGRHLCFYAGKVVDDVSYDHGKKCGIHKKFSLDGYKRSEITYHEGGEFFDTIYYDKTGQKEYSAIWKNGMFFESRYEDQKKISSRVGKIQGSIMVFQEDR